jgi:hypothetical protein
MEAHPASRLVQWGLIQQADSSNIGRLPAEFIAYSCIFGYPVRHKSFPWLQHADFFDFDGATNGGRFAETTGRFLGITEIFFLGERSYGATSASFRYHHNLAEPERGPQTRWTQKLNMINLRIGSCAGIWRAESAMYLV